jgi:amino acid adenylation domain-containing protein
MAREEKAEVSPVLQHIPQLVTARSLERAQGLAIGADFGSWNYCGWLCYGQLESRANGLAQRLRALGIGRGKMVGLCLPRSTALVVAALAVLKAGAAYVPLDPSYPLERISFMLSDCGAPVLVTTRNIAARIPFGKSVVLLMDFDLPMLEGGSVTAPDVAISPEDLAYVMYTSGSSGRPKGVQVTHGGLLNLIRWHCREFGVTRASRATLLASPGFDASAWEMWPYLCAGASLHVTPNVDALSAEALRDWLVLHKITISFVPTPLAESLLDLDWPPCDLRTLLTGGDVLHKRPRPGLPFKLINNYGPTECTVVTTSGEVLPQDGTLPPVPDIGRAIDNCELHVIDERLRPVRAGHPGELLIAGAGVAPGYLNLPAMKEDRGFLPNPFGRRGAAYRTGDLVRQLQDGSLEFLGRKDDQVKIHGYRVEPAEVVAALKCHPWVKDAVVMSLNGSTGRRLVAYVVARPGAPLTQTELIGHLALRLPDYMIPVEFVSMDALPLTAHGKIDRSRLREPDEFNRLATGPVWLQPGTEYERTVGAIISTLLNVKWLGSEVEFFTLGWHCLLGPRLITQINELWGVNLTLGQLFDPPTVAGVAGHVAHLRSRRETNGIAFAV